MNTNQKPRVIATAVAVLFVTFAFAQIHHADILTASLGKTAESSELKELKSGYTFEMVNDNHYLSKEGVELLLKDGILSEVNLYHHSISYGEYKGALPKGLSFGLTPGEVRNKLGKASTEYASGYSEFSEGNYVISCWFDGGKLSQVGLSYKAPAM